MTVIKCPTHGVLLEKGECPECGWRGSTVGSRSARDIKAGTCRFKHNGARCPFPAVVSESIGRADFIWCHFHADPDNRHHGREQDVFFADHKTDDAVRYRMRQWYGDDWREAAVQQIIEAHPAWQRQAGESASDYARRMLDEMAKRQAGAVKRTLEV